VKYAEQNLYARAASWSATATRAGTSSPSSFARSTRRRRGSQVGVGVVVALCSLAAEEVGEGRARSWSAG
jgi:hypothetical protein